MFGNLVEGETFVRMYREMGESVLGGISPRNVKHSSQDQGMVGGSKEQQM